MQQALASGYFIVERCKNIGEAISVAQVAGRRLLGFKSIEKFRFKCRDFCLL
jgi:hypothetical protein